MTTWRRSLYIISFFTFFLSYLVISFILYRTYNESFGKILQKNKFICDISVQTYLVKWGEKQISIISLLKFWQKEERGERNDGMEVREKNNFGNMVAEIGEKKLRKFNEKKKWRISIVGLPKFIFPWSIKTTQSVSFNFDVSTVSFI